MESLDAALPPARRLGYRPWLELPVRPWLVLAVMMTLVLLTLAVFRYAGTLRERRLIESGLPTTGTIKTIGLAAERQASRDEPHLVKLVYTDPKTGREVQSQGTLPRKEKSMIRLSDAIAIKVDPTDPNVWTARTEPSPLSAELAVPMLMLPLAAGCWVASFFKKQNVARVVRTAPVRSAKVVSVRQSPLAPMSKQIGVVIDAADRRVRPMYWPSKLGPVHPDFAIEVIAADRGPVLAAKSYRESRE